MKSKTLKLNENLVKKVFYSNTTLEDLTAYYKAYQMGCFEKMHPCFSKKSLLEKEDFKNIFVDFALKNNLASVTFFSKTKEEDYHTPVGMGTFWPRGRVIQIENLIWFPWATTRQIFENTFNFYDGVRNTLHPETKMYMSLLEFAEEKDEHFFDKLVNLNVLQKVGKIDGLYPDGKAVMYASKPIQTNKESK